MDRVLASARQEQVWGTPPILDAALAVAAVDPAAGVRLAGFLQERPPSQVTPSIVPKISGHSWTHLVYESWRVADVRCTCEESDSTARGSRRREIADGDIKIEHWSAIERPYDTSLGTGPSSTLGRSNRCGGRWRRLRQPRRGGRSGDTRSRTSANCASGPVCTCPEKPWVVCANRLHSGYAAWRWALFSQGPRRRQFGGAAIRRHRADSGSPLRRPCHQRPLGDRSSRKVPWTLAVSRGTPPERSWMRLLKQFDL